jgi:hypothetical protein
MSSKKTQKKGIFFFNTLFYFSKMDKNKCPKKFLRKKFQKTRIFTFFYSRIYKKNQIIPEKYCCCCCIIEIIFSNLFSLIKKITKSSPKIAILVFRPSKNSFLDGAFTPFLIFFTPSF